VVAIAPIFGGVCPHFFDMIRYEFNIDSILSLSDDINIERQY